MPDILISAYKPAWPQEFAEVAARLRRLVGAGATRIDHIGSTSVPDLAAKDVIDIQISVLDLGTQTLTKLLAAEGYHWVPGRRDLMVGLDPQSSDLDKEFLRQPDGQRPLHIHVRQEGRLNQRYALVFRDFLRADVTARSAYAQVKRALARYFPNDVEAYYAVKDPYMDTLYLAAQRWAEAEGWRPDNGFA